MAGKGDRQRPIKDRDGFGNNFDRIFNKGKDDGSDNRKRIGDTEKAKGGDK